MVSKRTLERLLAEKDRQIDILAEQIEWLRNQLGAPSMAGRVPVNPSEQPEIAFGVAPFVNEDEEDVQALLEAGHITKEQIPDVLEALGYPNTEVHFA